SSDLAHGHHVRGEAQSLVTPEMTAHAAEAGLDLVGDDQPARPAHDLDGRIEEAMPDARHALVREERTQHQPGEAMPSLVEFLDGPRDVRRECTGLGLGAAAERLERIGCRYPTDMGRPAPDRWPPGRKGRHRGG